MDADQLKHQESPAMPDVRRLPSPDRAMSISPLDLRQARFGTSLRGFNKDEVTSMLAEAAEAFNQSLRDNERLRHEIARLEGALSHYRDIEGTLKSALMSAQKVGDDMRANASQEAARLVREAETRAVFITEQAERRLDDVQREIDALRLRRRDVERNVSSIITSLSNTLDFIREQDEREHRPVLQRPRLEAAS